MPRPSSPLDAKASTRCPSFTSLPSPRPSRKISPPRSLATSRGPRPRIAQRSAREEPDLAAEAGQHTHAVEHAHTMHPVTRRQRSSSTGACPRSLARHSPCHHNDPILSHRRGFRPSRHSLLRRPVAGGTGPPRSRETSWGVMVGPGRFERPTSPLSGVRSNQLSYGPGMPEIRCRMSDVSMKKAAARASPAPRAF